MATSLSRPAGQDLPCWIYRLVSTGSLDETIVERQAGKTSLLAAITGKKLPSVSPEDRALLFKLDADDVPSRLLEHLQQVGGGGAGVRVESAYADPDAWRRHIVGGDAAAVVAEVPPPFLSTLASAQLQELTAVAMQADEGGEADDEAGGDEVDDGAAAGDDAGFREGSGPLVSFMLHRFTPRKGSSRMQAVRAAASDAAESAVRAVSGITARSSSVGSVLADAGASESESESEPDDEGCDTCTCRCRARDMSECEICTGVFCVSCRSPEVDGLCKLCAGA